VELWDAFNQVCSHLRAGLLNGPPAEGTKSRWEHVVEISSLFHVLPALAYCLTKRTDLPSDVELYFKSVLLLNTRRNNAILDTVEPTIRRLQSIGIDPILLKGTSLLVEELYPPGTRLVGDADLLVTPAEADRALATLAENEYIVSDTPLPTEHRHLPILIHRETGLAVELHTRLEQTTTDSVVPLEWFCAGCRQVPFRGLLARVPDATRLVAMNFVHHRVNDRSRPSPVELRWLLDLALLRVRYEREIDWHALDQFAINKGYGEAFSTYLAFGEWLFHQTAPLTSAPPITDALKQLREYVDPWERERPSHMDILFYSFDTRAAQHVDGCCWRVLLPPEFIQGDVEALTRNSSLELFEEGRKLGPAFASLQIITSKGKGAFAHRGSELLFSASDNADLRTTDRRYLAKGWAVFSDTGSHSVRTKDIELLRESLSQSAAARSQAERQAGAAREALEAARQELATIRVQAEQEIASARATAEIALRDFSDQLLNYRNELATTREALSTTYNSLSWRLTRPLRVANGLFVKRKRKRR